MFLGLLVSAGAAQAYTRAYLVNKTGETAYSLHVTLLHPAQANSAGSGYLEEVFLTAKVSVNGLELEFKDPLDPAGIENDTGVWIGWNDANPSLPADIVSFYWADANGNMIGQVQQRQSTSPSDSPGDPSGGTSSGNNDPGSGVSGDVGTLPDSTSTSNGDTQTPGSGGSDPTADGTQSTATPEPGGMALILSGFFLVATSARLRRGLGRR